MHIQWRMRGVDAIAPRTWTKKCRYSELERLHSVCSGIPYTQGTNNGMFIEYL